MIDKKIIKKVQGKNPVISVIIIAKNEENKIEDCIKSIQKLTVPHEIILVDTGSTDKTIPIVKKYTDKIYKIGKGSYSQWRNYGLEKAAGNWVLYLDSDERITPALAKEIDMLVFPTVHRPLSTVSVYAIPRLNNILGKNMKHGGWWPDYVKRLFKKSKVLRWEGELHEEPVFTGEMGHMKNYLIHIKHNNLEEMVEKTNKWSDVEARLMFDAKHPKMNLFRFISAMWREFFLRMIKHRAFLDGKEGIIYALYQVWSRFVSYAKLWELQNKVQNSKIKG